VTYNFCCRCIGQCAKSAWEKRTDPYPSSETHKSNQF
jgi:hypothetical protein